VRGLTRSLLFAVTATAPLAITAEEDPFAALDAQLEGQFQDLDQQLEAEYQAIDAAIEAAFQRLKAEAEAVWGQDDAALPTQSVWVDYSDDMQSRRQFDFEEGVLKIEQIVDDTAIRADLLDSLVASVAEAESDTDADLSAKDAVLNYAKETLAAQDIALTEAPAASNAPVLVGLMALEDAEVAASIETQLGSALQAPVAANAGSGGASANAPDQGAEAEASSGEITVSSAILSSGAKKVTVTIPFAVDYLSESAQRYQDQVIEEANRRGLPPSLVYAIMETESHFNPRARSHIPAFGLMQLVPSSGGLDAYHYVYGEKLVLGPEYYFNPDQNVELGTAYLDLLLTRYLRAVENEESRTLCAIAAYNTGAGNVARSFSGGTSVRGAAPLINALEPEAVYEHLIANLPYEETRNYVKKVTKARERYRALDQPSA
jgi:membrane-bound lytic murein transglycosylase C